MPKHVGPNLVFADDDQQRSQPVIWHLRLILWHFCDRRTDRQTDGRTDELKVFWAFYTGGSYEKAVKNFPHWTPNWISVKQFGEKYENDHDIVFSRVREKGGEIIIFVVCSVFRSEIPSHHLLMPLGADSIRGGVGVSDLIFKFCNLLVGIKQKQTFEEFRILYLHEKN